MTLSEQPFPVALDIVYALILDESDPPRREARARLDRVLALPFDPDEIAEIEAVERQEAWDAEAEQAALAMDRMLGDG